jgi:hypothetical protein
MRPDAQSSKVDRRLVLTIAAKAEVDPRSVEKALREGPQSVRGMSGDRIARVLEKMGVVPPSAA